MAREHAPPLPMPCANLAGLARRLAADISPMRLAAASPSRTPRSKR
ncbi:Uncharacterised protein [Bordetella pertussis]|nr:Uncharacterised protein [Bordetella pertussis]